MADISSYPRSATESVGGAPVKILLDIDWQGDAAQKLLSAVARMERYDVLLRTIGRKVMVSIRRNFLEQRTPEGDRWAPLKRFPRGKGHGTDPRALIDKETLIDSIDFGIVDDQTVKIGYTADGWYGKFHQAGTRFIPQRRFLGIRDGDLPELDDELKKHINLAFDVEVEG